MSEEQIRYVEIDKSSFEMIKAKLAHEMQHGVDPDRGEYFQDKHVRYVVLKSPTP